jgi:hypothetical protein
VGTINLHLSFPTEEVSNRRWSAATQPIEPPDSRPTKKRRVRPVDHALRGLTDGILNVRDTPKKPCLVIGSFFPSWLLHVSDLGFFVDQVLVLHPSHIACIISYAGHTLPFGVGQISLN